MRQRPAKRRHRDEQTDGETAANDPLRDQPMTPIRRPILSPFHSWGKQLSSGRYSRQQETAVVETRCVRPFISVTTANNNNAVGFSLRFDRWCRRPETAGLSASDYISDRGYLTPSQTLDAAAFEKRRPPTVCQTTNDTANYKPYTEEHLNI